MPETLLGTKLFVPPLRPNLVPRPRLLKRLNQGLTSGKKLTLVSAPAGFGKTTLVREWVGGLRSDGARESQTVNRIAWLSLDENDNDPTRFLAYLVAALNQVEGIEASIGRGALDMLHSPQPPPAESVLTSLINDVTAVSNEIIFILDDYHLIGSSPVDNALTFMLEHLPPQMHLVIATREDPHLPLSRLRARGQLTELRGADLRFAYSEAAEFLNQVMGLALSEEDVKALEARTEGWIAGLQLVAISMQGREDASSLIQAFTGSHHYVLDCLIEEQADAIWQRGEHTKLRRWLTGLPVEAIYSRPPLCIFQAWDMFASGQQEAAELSLKAAERVLLPRVDPATRTSPKGQDQLTNVDRMKLQGRVATVRAHMAFFRGDVQGIYKYSHRALEYLPEEDLTWRSTATVALGDAYSLIGDLARASQVRSEALGASKAAGNIYMILIASMKLAITLRQQGQLERVIEICKQQLHLANESGLSQTAVIGWLLAIWGEVLAELDDLDGAIQRAEKGEELTRNGRDLGMIGWSNLCLMRILHSVGNIAGVKEVIRKMEIIARENYVPPWVTSLMSAWQARVWLTQGKLDTASQWVTERGLVADGDSEFLRETEYIVLARILIAQRQLDKATTLLQKLLQATESGGRISRMIEILLLQALVHQAGDDTSQALVKLERALTLAEPGGFIRIFIDEGPPMAQLLHEAAAREIAPDYVRHLLAAFLIIEPEPTTSPKTKFAIRNPQSEIVEPLSERELEVLELIAEGLTNREIASRLYLSLHTVKAHTRNIYSKLGVHNRTQAVSRARASGILPPL